MKKVLSTLLVCVLLAGCVFSLAGCVFSLGPMTMISGKYEGTALVADLTYEFSPFGGVTLTVDPIIGNSSTYEGKYKVNNETMEITFTFESDDADTYEGTSDFSSGEEDGVEYIKIGLLKYTKAD